MLFLTYITFCLNPLISLVFIILGILNDRKHNIHYSALLAGIFASLAYWVIPKGEMDLTRYFDIIQLYGDMNWEYFTSTILKGNLLFIQEIWFYLIGHTGNYHLLPATSIFTSYFIMFYMITDYSNRIRAKSSEVLFVILFLICVLPFISLVSNIRNILAFSIIAFAIYREFILGKKGGDIGTNICYILPIFVHQSSISLIFLKILANFASNNKAKNLWVIVVGVILSIALLNNEEILSSLPFVGDYLGAFISKANIYLNDSSSGYAQTLQTDLFSKLQKLYFVLTVCFLLLITYSLPLKKSIFKFENYYKYICYIVIVCFPIILTVYFRYTMAVLIVSFIIIFNCIHSIHLKQWKFIVYTGLFFIMLGGLWQQIYFFSKLAYFDEMIFNVGTRTFFNMFIQ